jgi:tetratricopeptide (TPR) repeat protein
LAGAYQEALERDPNQVELRLLFGQTLLKLGEAESALKEADIVLDLDKSRSDALLLQARALAESGRTPSEKDEHQRLAIAKLTGATGANPRLAEAFHTLAEIHLKRRDRAAALQVLKDDLGKNPDDSAALVRLIELLAGPLPADRPTKGAELEEATRIAREIASGDKGGAMILALAVGFHKARQLELALPYAEAAAKKLDAPAAHLNLGDILLTIAEGQSDQSQARASLERAVAEYDLVLKAQPSSIEAANNKAWILHTYLGQTRRALELVLALQQRVSAAVLPGEFYDTLGSIQESVGKRSEAERAYADGLKKSPEHPMLNFHFGKLIAADRDRAGRARSHLQKALDNGRLSPPLAQEAIRLVQRIDQKQNVE